MKKLLTLLFVGVFGLFAHAQDQQVDPNKPTIKFEKKAIDYGNIEKGANGLRVFKFKNEGNEPLILNSVRASCGCTTPKWTRDPIAPGETGEIQVKYDTQRVGSFHKTVTVKSNASNETVMLTIKGQVKQPEAVKTTPTKEGSSLIAK